MDQVCRGAQFTIVAAAGADSHYGLPGITHRGRTTRRRIKVGSAEIVEVFGLPDYACLQSKWGTRGWTFQESYLSQRRLIFTGTHITFVCNQMTSTWPEQITTTSIEYDRPTSRAFSGLRPVAMQEPMMGGQSGDPLRFALEAYSKRDLRFG